MRNASILAFLLTILIVALPPGVNAQDVDLKIGPRATLELGDLENIADFAIGADVRGEIADFPVDLHGAFSFYFADDPWTVFSVDLNAVFPFELEDRNIKPYAGGGLGFTRLSIDSNQTGIFGGSSSTEVGLNLVGGVEFELDNITPFAQAQFTTGTPDRFGLTGGILFNI